MALTRMFPKSAGRCFHQTDVGSVVRHFSDTEVRNGSYKLVIVGGGTGGCATAARFCRELLNMSAASLTCSSPVPPFSMQITFGGARHPLQV